MFKGFLTGIKDLFAISSSTGLRSLLPIAGAVGGSAIGGVYGFLKAASHEMSTGDYNLAPSRFFNKGLENIFMSTAAGIEGGVFWGSAIGGTIGALKGVPKLTEAMKEAGADFSDIGSVVRSLRNPKVFARAVSAAAPLGVTAGFKFGTPFSDYAKRMKEKGKREGISTGVPGFFGFGVGTAIGAAVIGGGIFAWKSGMLKSLAEMGKEGYNVAEGGTIGLLKKAWNFSQNTGLKIWGGMGKIFQAMARHPYIVGVGVAGATAASIGFGVTAGIMNNIGVGYTYDIAKYNMASTINMKKTPKQLAASLGASGDLTLALHTLASRGVPMPSIRSAYPGGY